MIDTNNNRFLIGNQLKVFRGQVTFIEIIESIELLVLIGKHLTFETCQ